MNALTTNWRMITACVRATSNDTVSSVFLACIASADVTVGSSRTSTWPFVT